MFEGTDIKIIEIHQHLGPSRVFDDNVTKEELIKALEENKIDICIVQLFPGVNDYVEKNNEIIRLCREFENRIFGLININPHLDDKEYDNEANRLMATGYFKAIKLHTIGYSVNPLSKDADKVYKFARKFEIPIMVHTGAGIPFALPSLIIPKAIEYMDIDFILAHAGMSIIYSSEAFITAQQYKNVYLETSWTSITDKNWFIKDLGSEKLIFGADVPSNIPVELFHYKKLNLGKQDLENIMFNNAKRLLKI